MSNRCCNYARPDRPERLVHTYGLNRSQDDQGSRGPSHQTRTPASRQPGRCCIQGWCDCAVIGGSRTAEIDLAPSMTFSRIGVLGMRNFFSEMRRACPLSTVLRRVDRSIERSSCARPKLNRPCRRLNDTLVHEPVVYVEEEPRSPLRKGRPKSKVIRRLALGCLK